MVDCDARELLDACSNGGGAADWEEFRRRFEPRLVQGVKRAFRWAGARPRADQIEDLVQESYCRLLEQDAAALKRCRSDSEVAIGVYLGRIAERVAIDHVRAAVAEKRGGGRVESLEALSALEGDRACPTTRSCAEERLLSRERLEGFLECCRRAAGRRRDRNIRVVRLALLEGLTSHEISQRLGNLLSPNGIDTLLHRVRLRLQAEGFVLPRRRPVSVG